MTGVPYKAKRLFDLVLACLLLFISFPMIFILSAYLLLVQKRNPLRWVDTSGKGGIPYSRPFFDLKGESTQHFFRKLTLSHRPLAQAVANLPSLLLVFKAKMSLIGPSSHHFRKHLFLAQRFEGYEKRLQALPGLITPAILAPKPCSEKLALEIEVLYCQKATLAFDLYLLCRYIQRIFQR